LMNPGARMERIASVCNKLHLHPGSVESYGAMSRLVKRIKPHEIYHLAAQSFVAESFVDESATLTINVIGTLNMLMAIRDHAPECKFYFAGSSEMFGKVVETPQSERTPFHPRSPYGVSKVAGFDLTRHFREAYGLFACSGMLFNHESPRRGMEFVTRKIACGVAAIKAGKLDKLRLGNLGARRDWGHSREYVEAMHLMLRAGAPDDFVIATGETHSIEEFCDAAFSYAGLDWTEYVVSSTDFMRPSDVELLQGDATKAKEVLGWEPKITFMELAQEMVQAELDNSKKKTLQV